MYDICLLGVLMAVSSGWFQELEGERKQTET
jgi:hypothetical protein